MSSPKMQNQSPVKSQEKLGKRYSQPAVSNDVNSVIDTSAGSSLSQKDIELACQIIVDYGIDPRSLAFEILSQRVLKLIKENAHKRPGKDKNKFLGPKFC